jgi:hypothetical protein
MAKPRIAVGGTHLPRSVRLTRTSKYRPTRVRDSEQESALAEFHALRAEILLRLENQHGLYVLQLGASGAILSFALADTSHLAAAFLVPLLSYLVGYRFYMMGMEIGQIGIYIQESLSPRIQGGLPWEGWITYRRPEIHIATRRIVPRFVNILPFIGPAVIAWCVGFYYLATARIDISQRVGLSLLAILALASTGSVGLLWRIDHRLRLARTRVIGN